VSHLEQVGSEELDRLLGIVVDVENLFMCVHKVILPDENYIVQYRMYFANTASSWSLGGVNTARTLLIDLPDLDPYQVSKDTKKY
jgi:hypothetical protein